jgi:hypothetical protein
MRAVLSSMSSSINSALRVKKPSTLTPLMKMLLKMASNLCIRDSQFVNPLASLFLLSKILLSPLPSGLLSCREITSEGTKRRQTTILLGHPLLLQDPSQGMLKQLLRPILNNGLLRRMPNNGLPRQMLDHPIHNDLLAKNLPKKWSMKKRLSRKRRTKKTILMSLPLKPPLRLPRGTLQGMLSIPVNNNLPLKPTTSLLKSLRKKPTTSHLDNMSLRLACNLLSGLL